jgi:serine/threonine-protein kinase
MLRCPIGKIVAGEVLVSDHPSSSLTSREPVSFGSPSETSPSEHSEHAARNVHTAHTVPAPPLGAVTVRPNYEPAMELFELDAALLALPPMGSLGLDDPTMELRGGPVVLIEPDPLVGRILGGEKFEIDSLVGSGASGAVYKARHLDLRRDVAIKVLHPHFQNDPQFGTRFHREALAASQLDHPNILRVHDFGQERDGLSYIVMELLAGVSLRGMLEGEKRLAPARCVQLISQVLLGLAVAHDQGIVHHDVKADNIVVVRGRNEDGDAIEVAKVCDFGIAALHDDQSDARSDVYAAGCMLYELLTGTALFEKRSSLERAPMLLDKPPVPPSQLAPGIPPQLDAVVLRALAASPDQRPQTARDLRTELREAMEAATLSEANTRKAAPAITQTPSVDVGNALLTFVTAFATALLGAAASPPARTAIFDAEIARAHAALASALGVVSEVSLVRRDTERARGFFLLLGGGQAFDLRALFTAEQYETLGVPFVEEVARHKIASISLSAGITDLALGGLVRVLCINSEDAPRVLSMGRLAGISAILPVEIVGRDRKLPWKVGLSLSRLAQEVSRLADVPPNTPTEADVLQEGARRTTVLLHKAEELAHLFFNLDLVGGEGARPTKLVFQLVASLPIDRAVDLTTLLFSQLDLTDGRDSERRALLPVLARRLMEERTPATYEPLCDLGLRGLVPVSDLPEDVGLVVRANVLARSLGTNPTEYLAALSAMEDSAQAQIELTVLKGALRILARRGEAVALLASLKTLARIANSKEEPGLRERLALKVIGSVVTEARLVPVANVLLLGQTHVREAAGQVVAMSGEAGVLALVAARQALREPSGRAHFVVALSAMGVHAEPALLKALAHTELTSDAADPTLVEDLLRAVGPELLAKLRSRASS